MIYGITSYLEPRNQAALAHASRFKDRGEYPQLQNLNDVANDSFDDTCAYVFHTPMSTDVYCSRKGTETRITHAFVQCTMPSKTEANGCSVSDSKNLNEKLSEALRKVHSTKNSNIADCLIAGTQGSEAGLWDFEIRPDDKLQKLTNACRMLYVIPDDETGQLRQFVYRAPDSFIVPARSERTVAGQEEESATRSSEPPNAGLVSPRVKNYFVHGALSNTWAKLGELIVTALVGDYSQGYPDTGNSVTVVDPKRLYVESESDYSAMTEGMANFTTRRIILAEVHGLRDRQGFDSSNHEMRLTTQYVDRHLHFMSKQEWEESEEGKFVAAQMHKLDEFRM